MPVIEVLGTGCPKCDQLMKNAEQAVAQLERSDSVEKVDDIVKILDFAPNALPALAIDGQVVCAGGLPSVAEVCTILSRTSTPDSRS